VQFGLMLTEVVQPRVSHLFTDPNDDFCYPIVASLSVGVFLQGLSVLAMAAVIIIDKRNEIIEAKQHLGINEAQDENAISTQREEDLFEEAQKTPILKRLWGLGSSFLFYSAVMTFEFFCLIPFNANLNLLLQTRFQLSSVEAGTIIVIFNIN